MRISYQYIMNWNIHAQNELVVPASYSQQKVRAETRQQQVPQKIYRSFIISFNIKLQLHQQHLSILSLVKENSSCSSLIKIKINFINTINRKNNYLKKKKKQFSVTKITNNTSNNYIFVLRGQAGVRTDSAPSQLRFSSLSSIQQPVLDGSSI